MAFAAIWNAPGSRSPSWPFNSSAATFPFEIICWSAFSAPACWSADRPSFAPATEIASKISRVCWPSNDVPLAAAANFINSVAVDPKDMPSRSVTSLKYFNSEDICASPKTVPNEDFKRSASTRADISDFSIAYICCTAIAAPIPAIAFLRFTNSLPVSLADDASLFDDDERLVASFSALSAALENPFSSTVALCISLESTLIPSDAISGIFHTPCN